MNDRYESIAQKLIDRYGHDQFSESFKNPLLSGHSKHEINPENYLEENQSEESMDNDENPKMGGIAPIMQGRSPHDQYYRWCYHWSHDSAANNGEFSQPSINGGPLDGEFEKVRSDLTEKKEPTKANPNSTPFPQTFKALDEILDSEIIDIIGSLEDVEANNYPIVNIRVKTKENIRVASGDKKPIVHDYGILQFKTCEFPGFCAATVMKNIDSFINGKRDWSLEQIQSVLDPIFDAFEDKIRDARSETEESDEIDYGIGNTALFFSDQYYTKMSEYLRNRDSWDLVLEDENPKTGNRVNLLKFNTV